MVVSPRLIFHAGKSSINPIDIVDACNNLLLALYFYMGICHIRYSTCENRMESITGFSMSSWLDHSVMHNNPLFPVNTMNIAKYYIEKIKKLPLKNIMISLEIYRMKNRKWTINL
jgi:hypothetical protein